MGQLHEIEDEIKELGYQLIAITPDLPENLEVARNKYDMSYTLLSDGKMTAAEAFGIAWRFDDDMYKKYTDFGVDIEQRSGESHRALPVPSVFIVDTEGTIHFEYVNPTHQIRIDPDVLLAAAKSLVKSE